MAIFIGTIAIGYLWVARSNSHRAAVGYDFIAFYTAGRFVQEGRTAQLYDLRAVSEFQHKLALANGTDLGAAVGPFWNPPFYAWLFVPLAKLSFPAAMRAWVAINLLCAAGAMVLMWRWLAASGNSLVSIVRQRPDWRSAALIPMLVILSTPFIHAISHGQNSCTSLLIVTAAVTLWRMKRALLAGVVAGLLIYKPQLAVVISVVLVLDLGWNALLGLMITGSTVLLATLALPGSLHGFVHQMPANLRFVQDQSPYLWERHVTYNAFWRLLLQGSAVGDPIVLVRILSGLCSFMTGNVLVAAIKRFRPLRGNPIHEATQRDRLIAAAIAATPLLMPFYFDYDQLLLAVPAVLLAGEFIRQGMGHARETADRWILRLWPIHYVWLMVNPDIALLTRVNLAVPLWVAVTGLLIARAGRKDAIDEQLPQRTDQPLAIAA